MSDEVETAELDKLQAAYVAAVERWIEAIKAERDLVAVTPHSVAKVDDWEAAHFREDDIREEVLELKKNYEDALREKFFGF
ncbi:MAG TPA: hypothetical protein VKV77_13605 [Methylovirgula sp.]|nr:hypothetical protein [Methylovirgula sp.]